MANGPGPDRPATLGLSLPGDTIAHAFVLSVVGTFFLIPHSGIAGPPGFHLDVIPVLTRFGCNAGACHGAAAGRGGFHLSLYGSRPDDDYRAIVEELEGRRVDLVDPGASLILGKPTEQYDHGGGTRFDPDSEPARLLRSWIRAGVPRGEPLSGMALEIKATTDVPLRVGSVIPLAVHARFDNMQKTVDVTRWTVFDAVDESATELLKNPVRIRILRPGRHIVMARYQNRIEPVEFLVSFALESRPGPDDSAVVPARTGDEKVIASERIDGFISRRQQQLQLPRVSICSDSEFLRRVAIDLTGRLPDAALTKRFLADPDPARRQRLIEQLMTSTEFVDWWTFLLDRMLRNRPLPDGELGDRAFRSWIRECVSEGRGWDQMVEEILLAEGDSRQQGPAHAQRLSKDAREQAEYVTEVLLGVRMRCANCHDHPLDRWTQDDYHGLAAIFARISRDPVVRYGTAGEVIHPGTGRPAVPRIPGTEFVNATEDPRDRLTHWIVSSPASSLAHALVNRLWQRLMGRGLVESVDDHRRTNPPSHPGLLDWLARDLIQHDWDWRRTIRLLVTTEVYQRGWIPESELPGISRNDLERFYCVPARRPLDAEVLMDAVADVTGVPENWPGQSSAPRTILLNDPQRPSRTLDLLGRCDREQGCESGGGDAGTSLGKHLHFFNSEFLNGRLINPEGRIARWLESRLDPEQMVRSLYILAYVRQPRPNELGFWVEELNSAGDQESRRKIVEDMVWAVLNSREFQTQH